MRIKNKRAHRRISAPSRALVIVSGSLCKVIDVSEGGLSLMFFDDVSTKIPKKISLGLLKDDSDKSRAKIEGEIVWKDVYVNRTYGVSNKVGIRFGKLTPPQQTQLYKLIKDFRKSSRKSH